MYIGRYSFLFFFLFGGRYWSFAGCKSMQWILRRRLALSVSVSLCVLLLLFNKMLKTLQLYRTQHYNHPFAFSTLPTFLQSFRRRCRQGTFEPDPLEILSTQTGVVNNKSKMPLSLKINRLLVSYYSYNSRNG